MLIDRSRYLAFGNENKVSSSNLIARINPKP